VVASNWSDACRRLGLAVPVSAELLVAIGRALGVDAAWTLYRGLAQEPIGRDGHQVDWAEIERRIQETT